ncbi:hypothetical protein [Lysobacter sp. A3-1-A15]|uniref:hypothetical protein n=1 Tax=Novilysobacter viscosus TaxID=3098602 RepID=UPI002ED9A7FB
MERSTSRPRLLAGAIALALLSSVLAAAPLPAGQADRTTQAFDAADDLPPPPVVDATVPVDPEVDAMNASPPPSVPVPRGELQTEGDAWVALDTDGDGRVSRAEARENARFSARFGSMDTDGDGHVGQSEFAAWLETGAGNQPEPEEED